jgi:hypothetical protein
MDDKIIAAIDASLAQVVTAIEEIRRSLVVCGAVPAETSVQNLQKTYANRELREVASKEYMSGRWVRRDGDGLYNAPIAARPVAIAPTMVTGDTSANRKTGDL